MAHIINRVHELKLPRDKHNRDIILASYVQYVFACPVSPTSSTNFDVHNAATLRSNSVTEEDALKRSSSLKHGGRQVVIQCKHVCCLGVRGSGDLELTLAEIFFVGS